ncbi:MAG: hypothetical protein K6F69_08690 [Treponema sp.]|nr:hypothetical protein [Treponema sp.]
MLTSYKLIVSLLYVLIFTTFIYAETFRVHKSLDIKVPQTLEEYNNIEEYNTNETGESSNTVEAEVNDGVIIRLPDDLTYIEGIELKIKIPQFVAEWPNSVVYTFYNNLSPAPANDVIDYRGTRVHTNIFPNRLSLVVQIPIKESIKLRASPYSVIVPFIPEIINNSIFFRLQLAMKGVPNNFEKSRFIITAKPIFIDKGKLELEVLPPSNTDLQPYTVFIDGTDYTHNEKDILLATGLHSVSIVSDFYRNEVRNVMIAQTETSKVSITLRDITPEIHITAPENAKIFIDGKEIENWSNVMQIPQGDHSFKFVVGDYEIMKTVKAENGRSYTVSIGIDATITEISDEESSKQSISQAVN